MPSDDLPTNQKRVTGVPRDTVIFLDKMVLAFARNWVACLAAVTAIYSGLPFVAPVAMHFGWTPVADAIYTVYGPPVCHQFAFRSFFLFGEQAAYPRALAGVATGTFEEYASQDPAFKGIDMTVLNPAYVLAARNFRGDERMGWKVAVCERDVGICLSLVAFSVLFILLTRFNVRLPYLPFWAYIAFAILPILFDGGSQYLANLQFVGIDLNFARESTPLLRVGTGALFGIGNGWLAFPYIQDSMKETRALVEAKLARAGILQVPQSTSERS